MRCVISTGLVSLRCRTGTKNSQFLIPMSSSTRPSYVNWVSRGVIMSTLRSIMIRESSLSDMVPSILLALSGVLV